MILYAQIVRTRDGLPLSASTDFNDEVNKSIKESKKYVKMMAYKAVQLPDRCVLQLKDVSIYLMTCLGVSYLVMTEFHYSQPLAFGFLKHLFNEFAQNYEAEKVNFARRPYEFIEFDNYIHKMRQAFNKPQSLTTRLDITSINSELSLCPPLLLSVADIEPVRNGYRPQPATQLGVGPPPRLEPLSPFHWISILFASLLVLLGFYRGLSALQVSTLEEYDGPSPVHGIIYILESMFRIFQIHLLLHNAKYRGLESWFCAAVLFLCIFFLWEFRDPTQHAVFALSTTASHVATMMRKLQPKLPDYHI